MSDRSWFGNLYFTEKNTPVIVTRAIPQQIYNLHKFYIILIIIQITKNLKQIFRTLLSLFTLSSFRKFSGPCSCLEVWHVSKDSPSCRITRYLLHEGTGCMKLSKTKAVVIDERYQVSGKQTKWKRSSLQTLSSSDRTNEVMKGLIILGNWPFMEHFSTFCWFNLLS